MALHTLLCLHCWISCSILYGWFFSSCKLKNSASTVCWLYETLLYLFSGAVGWVCPPLIQQTIQLPRPHRKRKLDVTHPPGALLRQIVTNKQWRLQNIQKNIPGQSIYVWQTNMDRESMYISSSPLEHLQASHLKTIIFHEISIVYAPMITPLKLISASQ